MPLSGRAVWPLLLSLLILLHCSFFVLRLLLPSLLQIAYSSLLLDLQLGLQDGCFAVQPGGRTRRSPGGTWVQGCYRLNAQRFSVHLSERRHSWQQLEAQQAVRSISPHRPLHAMSVWQRQDV